MVILTGFAFGEEKSQRLNDRRKPFVHYLIPLNDPILVLVSGSGQYVGLHT